MSTAIEILEYLGFAASPDDDDDQGEWLRDKLKEVLNGILVPQMTGGADWSSRYVWGVPTKFHDAAIHDAPLKHAGDELFLVWDNGELDEPLEFMRRWEQDGGWELELVAELTGPIVHQMELAQPERSHRRRLR